MQNGPQAPANAEGPTQHTQNQAQQRPAGTFGYTRAEQIEALHKLREAFAPQEIRYLPRVWCGQCKNARGGCNQHPANKCGKCKQKMPNGGHIDLAYVGHAEATNRLLNVDPFWDWEPLTVDERGLPQLDGYSGLWIRLTVCGMTRLGYGHANGKTGGDSIKEIIGDAIRNAGMRFGMALDLWTTSDLEIIESGGVEDEATSPPAKSNQRTRPAAPAPQAPNEPVRPAMAPEQTQAMALEAFKPKVVNGWNNADAVQQNLLEAKAKSLLNEVIPAGPDKVPTRIEDLLKNRLAELKAGRQERNAA